MLVKWAGICYFILVYNREVDLEVSGGCMVYFNFYNYKRVSGGLSGGCNQEDCLQCKIEDLFYAKGLWSWGGGGRDLVAGLFSPPLRTQRRSSSQRSV